MDAHAEYSFGSRLEWVLNDRKISSAELASHLGVTRYAVSKWLNNKQTTTLRQLKQICLFLEVSSDFLLGLDKETTKSDPLYKRTIDAQQANQFIHRVEEQIIGRGDEIRVLVNFLSFERDTNLMVVFGQGGTGKTRLGKAIAAAFADIFGRSSTIPIRIDGEPFNLDTLLTLIRFEIDLQKFVDFPPSAATRKAEIRHALNQSGRKLLWIDNFQKVTDRSAAIQIIQYLLHEMPPSVHVIVLTQDADISLWYDVRFSVLLNALADNTARMLLNDEAEQLQYDAFKAINDDDLRNIFTLTNKNPYALRLIVRLMKAQHLPPKQVIGLLERGEPQFILDVILGDYWNKASDAEKQVWTALALFTGSITEDALRVVTALSDSALSQALGNLINNLIVTVDEEGGSEGPLYELHSLPKTFALSRFPADQLQVLRERRAMYYRAFLEQHLVRGDQSYWNTLIAPRSNLKLIDSQLTNLQELLQWAERAHEDEWMLDLVMLLVHYLQERMFFDLRFEYTAKAAAAAERLGRKWEAAVLRIDGFAWVAMVKELFDVAIDQIKMGYALVEDLRSDRPQEAIDLDTLTWTWLAHCHRLKWKRATLALVGCKESEWGKLRATIDDEMKEAETALQLAQTTLSNSSPVIAYRFFRVKGDICSARELEREAIECYIGAIDKGTGIERLDEARNALGHLYRSRGDFARAHDQFLAMVEEHLSADKPTIGAIRGEYGLALIAQKRGDKVELAKWTSILKTQLRELPPSSLLEIREFIEDVG